MIRSITHRGETVSVKTRASEVAGPTLRLSRRVSDLKAIDDEVDRYVAMVGAYLGFLGEMTDRSREWWDETASPSEVVEYGSSITQALADPNPGTLGN